MSQTATAGPLPAFPRHDPADHGLDPARLADLATRLGATDAPPDDGRLDDARSVDAPPADARPDSAEGGGGRPGAGGLGVESLMVLRHGAVVFEWWAAGQSPTLPHPMYSVTKSVVSTAVGMAVDEGRLSVDEPVLAFFPTYATATVRANVAGMTLRHLLTMSSGHRDELWQEMKARPGDDWVRMFLETPLDAAPGARFCYSSANSHLLSAALANRTGLTVAEFLAPRLFDPLGIGRPEWETDGRGVPVGGRGLSLRTADLAALGQLYLDRGRWGGHQLVSGDWVELASTAHIATESAELPPEWHHGYGFHFWHGSADTFRADGAYGQFAIVSPAREMVVAVTATSDRAELIVAAAIAYLDTLS